MQVVSFHSLEGFVRLEKRVAIVTGNAQGLGKAFALGLSKEGAQFLNAIWKEETE